jgi:hypothetical protein
MRNIKNFYLKNCFFFIEHNQSSNSAQILGNFRNKILWNYLKFACRFQFDPKFIENLEQKGISHQAFDEFLEVCLEYKSKLELKDKNMVELVEWFMQIPDFKPFFVFFYDQSISKTRPWITQVTFVHQKTNMFVRISYNDFKFGFFLVNPFYYDEKGVLRFIRHRSNEVGKYSNGFLIPPSKFKWNSNRMSMNKMMRDSHYHIQEMCDEDYYYSIKHTKQIAIFNPTKAREIKGMYSSDEENSENSD